MGIERIRFWIGKKKEGKRHGGWGGGRENADSRFRDWIAAGMSIILLSVFFISVLLLRTNAMSREKKQKERRYRIVEYRDRYQRERKRERERKERADISSFLKKNLIALENKVDCTAISNICSTFSLLSRNFHQLSKLKEKSYYPWEDLRLANFS